MNPRLILVPVMVQIFLTMIVYVLLNAAMILAGLSTFALVRA